MKVIVDSTREIFAALKPGDCFRLTASDTVYVKTDMPDLAVNLTTGGMSRVEQTHSVVKVIVEAHVVNDGKY